MTVAVVFPGQGSQKIGMLDVLAEEFTPAKAIIDKANETLGYDIIDLINNNPEDKLNQTAYTQPALLVTEYLLYQCWQAHHDMQPSFLAGHSLGEYTALLCAEAISLEDSLHIVKLRGELMQMAVAAGVGAMAAIIGLDNQAIEKICREVSSQGADVACANYNSPGQVVISGYTNAVEHAMSLATKKGAKMVKKLAVSVPSHSLLMRQCADNFARIYDHVAINLPKIPVLHNIDAKTRSNPGAIADALISQLYLPVQWVNSVSALAQEGITKVIECGPGKVLSGLIKRIDKSLTCHQLATYAQCVEGFANV